MIQLSIFHKPHKDSAQRLFFSAGLHWGFFFGKDIRPLDICAPLTFVAFALDKLEKTKVQSWLLVH